MFHEIASRRAFFVPECVWFEEREPMFAVEPFITVILTGCYRRDSRRAGERKTNSPTRPVEEFWFAVHLIALFGLQTGHN